MQVFSCISFLFFFSLWPRSRMCNAQHMYRKIQHCKLNLLFSVHIPCEQIFSCRVHSIMIKTNSTSYFFASSFRSCCYSLSFSSKRVPSSQMRCSCTTFISVQIVLWLFMFSFLFIFIFRLLCKRVKNKQRLYK